MRAIRKQGTGGFHLNQSHANPPQTPEQADSRWRSFGYKNEVRTFLLAEQFHLCCYSELRADEATLGYHIEHVENKAQNPSRTFDYTNLAASALDSANDLRSFNARGDELFGGHAPGKIGASGPIDFNRFISPNQPDCRRFFTYLSDGRVVPADEPGSSDRDRAQYTIETLNLNSPFLVTLRRQWWDDLDELLKECVQQDWSLHDLVAIYLVPRLGKLDCFFSLTRQFFGLVAEQTLTQHAPELL